MGAINISRERAVELLSALPQVRDVKLLEQKISVTFGDGQAGDGIIARTLVAGNIDVVALVPEQLKLDEAFLHLTKGAVH